MKKTKLDTLHRLAERARSNRMTTVTVSLDNFEELLQRHGDGTTLAEARRLARRIRMEDLDTCSRCGFPDAPITSDGCPLCALLALLAEGVAAFHDHREG